MHQDSTHASSLWNCTLWWVRSKCQRVVHEFWRGEGVFQMQVTALDPRPEKGQTELFGDEEDRFHRLNRVMDDVNNRYGEFTLTRAALMHRSDMPNVIAPAWKPYGHRQPTTERRKPQPSG